MLIRNVLAALGGALALTSGLPQAALAQDVPDRPGVQSRSEEVSGTIRGERTMPGRVGGDRNDRRQNRSRSVAQRAARTSEPMTPEQLQAAAQAQVTAAGLACQVTQALGVGLNTEQQPVMEASCASGPGYIIIASTPPQTFDCIELAGTAIIARERNPEADVGQQCTLPANQNAVQVIGTWAREAGVTCTVDQAQAIGKSDDDNMIYEVGCADTDGFWLERASTGWKTQECLQINSAGGACKFTSAAEQATGFQSKLAGTDAADCAVSQVRLMGQSPNGRFYEAKCSAGGGYVARLSTEGVTQQVYTCEAARNIGSGCSLTPVAPNAAPTTTE